MTRPPIFVQYFTPSDRRPAVAAWIRENSDVLPDRIFVSVHDMDNGILIQVRPLKAVSVEAALSAANGLSARYGVDVRRHDARKHPVIGVSADRIRIPGVRPVLDDVAVDFSAHSVPATTTVDGVTLRAAQSSADGETVWLTCPTLPDGWRWQDVADVRMPEPAGLAVAA